MSTPPPPQVNQNSGMGGISSASYRAGNSPATSVPSPSTNSNSGFQQASQEQASAAVSFPSSQKLPITQDSSSLDIPPEKLIQLRNLLESSNPKDKLLGMKRVVAMMSKGRDVESLFPWVVKNVICKTLEVKKLVYIYLIHYAEKQQDEALLSVNNFQKDLNDKNQFIRALALRVMSSIRVSLITQIVVMAIKKCSTDMSPYVRKSACLAIPKAFELDLDLKDELSEIIGRLLKDNNSMVIAAAVYAFNEVCPQNYDLIHPQFRKICKYVLDCDEWGQVVVLNMLTRYARTQFTSPLKEDGLRKRNFYSSDSDDYNSDEDKKEPELSNPTTEDLDPDHRLLLNSVQPLLRTRNAAVVLAVCSLFYHIAPINEQEKIILPLLRLCQNHRENQFVVLSNIATVTKERPEFFRKHLKNFYVYHRDPLVIKNLKLEILSVLADEGNIQEILRELRSYVRFPQKEFVARTIEAICRVATNVPEVCETCIHGLLKLLKSNNSDVVTQSVIAVRHLLQQDFKERKKIVRTMVPLIGVIKSDEAKSNIVWIIGEFLDDIEDMAPDALRLLARDFCEQKDLVKLQIINLGTKLFLRFPEKVETLFQYILQLGRYDQNYDVRDRVRVIRSVFFSTQNSSLREKAEEVFCAEKTKPSFDSSFHERSRFALGSLSHLVNHSTFGYLPLPEFPEEQPDTRKLRQVSQIVNAVTDIHDQAESIASESKFYTDSDVDTDDSYGFGGGEAEFTDSDSTEGSYSGSSAGSEDGKSPSAQPGPTKPLDDFYSDEGSETGSDYTESGSYSDTGSDYSSGSESPRAAPRGKGNPTLIDFS